MKKAMVLRKLNVSVNESKRGFQALLWQLEMLR